MTQPADASLGFRATINGNPKRVEACLTSDGARGACACDSAMAGPGADVPVTIRLRLETCTAGAPVTLAARIFDSGAAPVSIPRFYTVLR